MSEFDFVTRHCPHCKMDRMIAYHFSPKGKHCRDCQRGFLKKRPKQSMMQRRRGLETFQLMQKQPFEWEGI